MHHGNTEKPQRCFTQLYKLYDSLCTPTRLSGAYYLKPLRKPTPPRMLVLHSASRPYHYRQNHRSNVQASWDIRISHKSFTVSDSSDSSPPVGLCLGIRYHGAHRTTESGGRLELQVIVHTTAGANFRHCKQWESHKTALSCL